MILMIVMMMMMMVIIKLLKFSVCVCVRVFIINIYTFQRVKLKRYFCVTYELHNVY